MRKDCVFRVCFYLIFISFVFLSLHFQVSAQTDEYPYPNSHFATIDSVRLHYRTWNDTLAYPKGKVFLVHGFCGSTFCWRENFDTLASCGYRVVAIDLPGFGYSDRSLNVNQSQSNRARLLWSFLFKIEKGDTSGWNLVGHSMGGGTVEAMALLHPEHTKSLTIVDGLVFLKNENMQGAFVTMSKNKQYNKVIVSFTKKNLITSNTIKKLLRKNYGYIPDSAVVNGYLEPLLIKGTAECVINVFANSKEIIHLNSVGFKDLPVLVIWGRKDRTIYLSSGERFHNNVPSSEFRVIPEARHAPMETHPQIFNKYLLEFLSGIH